MSRARLVFAGNGLEQPALPSGMANEGNSEVGIFAQDANDSTHCIHEKSCTQKLCATFCTLL